MLEILMIIIIFCLLKLIFLVSSYIFLIYIFNFSLSCAIRVICKCTSCQGNKHPMRPSEWERHTGCRKKKWKESIRVKDQEHPLFAWVSFVSVIHQSLYTNVKSWSFS